MSAPRRDPLLATKLYHPPRRPDLVPRPRLVERLTSGLAGKLTLVSAPAGYGKTTLLGEWIASCGLPVAWVSLDEGDNDPARFWSYVGAAVAGLGSGQWRDGSAPARAPAGAEPDMTALINAFTGLSRQAVLVLDDFHVIEAEGIQRAIAFLLDHMPPQLHLVILSRSDPPLPLARLRGRGHLLELRAHDLRFTEDETADFLRGALGLDLPAEQVATLDARTEGWVAGLRLAALALDQCRDVDRFIEAFTGSHRAVVDYLVDEVLSRQPAEVQSFLLETSILERLSGPLCDAVTERGDGQRLIEQLERANLFLVPLDEERRWYRYHHLFASVLRERLQRARPERMTDLHERAAAWFEAQRLFGEAIQHAVDGEQWSRAVRLLARTAPTFLMRGQFATLVGWMDKLPAGLVRSESRLCRKRAWALIYLGRLDEIEGWLTDAERGPWETTPPEVRAEITVIRASVARHRGEARRAIALTAEAWPHLPPNDPVLRGVVQITLAVAYGIAGDIERAEQALDEADRIAADQAAAVAHGRAAADSAYLSLISLSHRARMRLNQGQLRAAELLYRRALARAMSGDAGDVPATSYALVGLGAVAYEWNELERAATYLSDSITLGEGGRIELTISGYVNLANVKQAQGDGAGALEMVRQAQMAAESRAMPQARRTLEAEQVRLWLRQGNVLAAAHWADTHDACAGGDWPFRPETEDVTCARVQLALGHPERALAVLPVALERTRLGGRVKRSIEILALLAIAYQAYGDQTQALATLREALGLAEPEGFIRVFLDEGVPMRALLATAKDACPASTYVDTLLAAFDREAAPGYAEPAARGPQPAARIPQPDVLSPRELDVLRLIAAGRSNREIAEQLFVTVGTVKRHTNSLYGKLGIGSRTAAVARGRELGVLG